MSNSDSKRSNLNSVEILGLIKTGKHSTALEKIRIAQKQGISINVDSNLLAQAYREVIATKRTEYDHLSVIKLYFEKFELVPIQLSDREGFFESLNLYLKEIKDELSKHDWHEIIALLNWQNNYLKLIGKEPGLIGQLELAISQFIEYEKRAPLVNESEVEGFIQETKATFLKVLPSEESLDYAAQIILHS